MPKVAVIIPTYNEAQYIEQRLNNIYEQEYPRNKITVIIVDSESTDGTPELALKWALAHKDLKVIILKEFKRQGKLSAVLYALKHVPRDVEVVVFTDADALWRKDTLRNVVKYLSDHRVGSVTGSVQYIKRSDESKVQDELVYRSFYNVVRVAESKIHSTCVHNGILQAIRYDIIRRYGLPTFSGADDTAFGNYIAFLGYRAIQVEDAWAYEFFDKNTFKRKVRRAQHVILGLLLSKFAAKAKLRDSWPYSAIWLVNVYLTVINPWLLVASAAILFYTAIKGGITALLILLTALAFLIVKHARMWIRQQVYLIAAQIRNLWTRSEAW